MDIRELVALQCTCRCVMFLNIRSNFIIGVHNQPFARMIHCGILCQQLEIYHPSMYRSYFRKNDMEEPLPLDGADEDAAIPAHVTKDAKGEDEKNLEARFYRYGVRSEWLQIYRILNHRYIITTNSQFSVFAEAVVCLLYMQMD